MKRLKLTVFTLLFILIFSSFSHAADNRVLTLKDGSKLNINKVYVKEGVKMPAAGSLSIGAIQGIWDRLSNAAGFSAFVMYDPSDEINAYIAPVDRDNFLVVIQRGLLNILKTEDEVAGVVGHEIGHGVRKHSEKRQGNTIGVLIGANILSAILGGGTLGDLAAGLGANLAVSGYSRENEVEADDLGVEYSTKAGFSPWGLYNSINSMAKAGLVTPPSGFNSHPPTERRMTNLKNQAQKWEKQMPKPAEKKNEIKTAALGEKIPGKKTDSGARHQTGENNIPDANSALNRSDKADVIASYPISAGEKNVLTILHNRSITLYNSRRYREALAGFSQGAESYDGNYLAALWAARCAQRLRNRGEMQKWIGISLEINPNYIPAQQFKERYVR